MDKISIFCDLLIEANKTTNLVSKNDEQKLMARHVADSLKFAEILTLNSELSTLNLTWADIGSGAGFPVIPLCIHLPQIKFYAIEPRKKRCEFLNSVKQKLGLQNIEMIQRRAETCGLANMDYVSCRAVGSLQEDFDRAKKILKPGGRFLTVKSKRIIDELRAKNDKLLKKAKIWEYRLPPEELEYAMVDISILPL
ncbi:MAG: 16S rRNA (guanine(527)-N(7))-methyltransferase RsmG [Fibromonadales bacterium]|nr:16S rRNA (guanine(527)-N(7))-methyltransferase RsmG [Fibromonadales bacterium]